MPFVENLAPFFNVAEFADVGVLDGVVHNGIFSHGYTEIMAMAAREAQFTCAETATTRAATTASVLVLIGVTYRVRVVESDGTGVCTIRLESPVL